MCKRRHGDVWCGVGWLREPARPHLTAWRPQPGVQSGFLWHFRLVKEGCVYSRRSLAQAFTPHSRACQAQLPGMQTPYGSNTPRAHAACCTAAVRVAVCSGCQAGRGRGCHRHMTVNRGRNTSMGREKDVLVRERHLYNRIKALQMSTGMCESTRPKT